MENIRDWCISRQIWWGHQIPAWYCRSCNEKHLESCDDGSGLIVDVNAVPIVGEQRPDSCPRCGGGDLTQDPDVLDTWFSSALWPFSTLGWPDETPLLKTFYPTSVLVTGLDILFFWVARMMMMGIRFRDDAPFADVYLHAMVRDAEGQKMSKSKGNVIDPLGMMEKYGTDAFRFTLTAMAAQGRDIKLSEERIAGYRNFVTKLWNAARLIHMHVREDEGEGDIAPQALEDRWILSRLDRVVAEVWDALDGYYFNQAASLIYQFVWHEFCDWYLEIVKPRLGGAGDDGRAAREVARFSLLRLLALAHPIMPFVTEEIAQLMPGERGPLVNGPFPVTDGRWEDTAAEKEMELVSEIVGTVRTIRGEMNIRPGVEVEVLLRGVAGEETKILDRLNPVIMRLGRISRLDLDDSKPPKESASSPVSCGELYIPLAGIVDFRDEVKRLEKEIGRLEKDISRYRKKLGREDFIAKAPKEIVEKDRRILDESVEKRDYMAGNRDRILTWMES
jgi:valyl-tRNA synthetase